MGLGRFGGGVGAVRYLAECGARVTVTDLADEASLAESLTAIADVKLEALHLGGHSESDIRDADLVVASPAVPPGHPLLAATKAPVTTEIGLLWSRCRGRVIGVTGSVGKSTTAAMIHAILVASGRRAWLGGNIGGSLLADLDHIADDDWVVLELSSFQLEYLRPWRPRAAIAVVTNLRPNHLDRHGTLHAYRDAKQSLLRWQTSQDVAVLNRDDPDVSQWPTDARVAWFGTQDHDTDAFASFGAYLAGSTLLLVDDRGAGHASRLTLRQAAGPRGINAAAAAAAALAAAVEPNAIASALNDFRGLPHRLEELGEWSGRLWINDSKATTPEATIAALSSFDRPIRLIAGGADKGIDLAPMIDAIRSRGVSAYLSGQTARAIADALSNATASVSVHATFDESVYAAWTDSRPGDVILLSPGCASWGQFRDYRERGDRFREIAMRATSGDGAAG